MGWKQQNKKRISIFRLVCNTAVLVLIVFCMLAPRLLLRSSDIGAEQARVLYELGILEDYDGTYLAKAAEPKATSQAVLRLLGCGDENQAPSFYRYLKILEAPVLVEPSAGASSLTDTQGYVMLLRALGYPEDQLSGASSETVLSLAKQAGFGFLKDVRESGEALTNGDFSMMLYETMFLRPNTAEFPVYRILAKLNSGFAELLMENGLYDDIPEEYVPLFNNGVYKQDSFAVLPGTENRYEWTAIYTNTDAEYVASYVNMLLSGDWLREGTYIVEEGDLSATIELLYRPVSTTSTQELAVAIESYSDGTVKWALFLN